MIRDLVMITLGVIGGAVGTLWFVRYEFKQLVKDSKRKEDNNDIIFESSAEAYKVRDQLEELLEQYGCVSVSDLYGLIGETSSFDKNKIGWTDLKNIKIGICKFGYKLSMPKTIELK